MGHLLPNLNDEALQRYGIPEIAEHMPELFMDRPLEAKQVICVADKGVDLGESRYELWKNPSEIPGNGIDDDGNGYVDDKGGYNFYRRSGEIVYVSSHGNSVANNLVAACPELIAVMNAQIAEQANPSHFTGLEGLLYGANNGAIAANLSYHLDSDTSLRQVAEMMRAKGCIWLSPFPYSGSHPGNIGIDEASISNVLISACVSLSHSLVGSGHPDKCHVAVYAGSPSTASPVPGGLLAILKTIQPDLSYEELMALVFAGAEHVGGTASWCRYGVINHKRSVEELLGHSLEAVTVPAPDPVSEPEEDPEPAPVEEEVEDPVTPAPVEEEGPGPEHETPEELPDDQGGVEEPEDPSDPVVEDAPEPESEPVTVVRVETIAYLSDGTTKKGEIAL